MVAQGTDDTAPAAQRPPGPAQPSIKARALRLLAGREHSRAELERKLAPHEQAPGQLASALDELQAKGFINPQRVLDSVVHRRSARYGAARIEHELVGKGLDPQAISEAMSALQGSELERARAIWVRKFREPSQELKEQARQMRFLMGRGFSPEVAKKVTRGQ